MDAQHDRALVDGVRRGQRTAREALYRSFHRRVLAYLTVLVTDPDTVWDLTHDVFEKAFEAAARFDGEPASLAPWLMMIARNAALDHFRGQRRAAPEEPHVIERRREGERSEDGPRWGDDVAVHHALASLPEQQRHVLVMHYRDDRDASEIGHALGKTADAVRHIEQRALTTVRAQVWGVQRADP